MDGLDGRISTLARPPSPTPSSFAHPHPTHTVLSTSSCVQSPPPLPSPKLHFFILPSARRLPTPPPFFTPHVFPFLVAMCTVVVVPESAPSVVCVPSSPNTRRRRLPVCARGWKRETIDDRQCAEDNRQRAQGFKGQCTEGLKLDILPTTIHSTMLEAGQSTFDGRQCAESFDSQVPLRLRGRAACFSSTGYSVIASWQARLWIPFRIRDEGEEEKRRRRRARHAARCVSDPGRRELNGALGVLVALRPCLPRVLLLHPPLLYLRHVHRHGMRSRAVQRVSCVPRTVLPYL
ncbi:hypothetical protein C8R47DRAFT_391109 [Mycena vitilis]|nr:hypothetical protein C8R47DRAFT_391109 [Mycena vitilis]